MGGAMENWGCVTWSDASLHRSPPSYLERESRALVLLHEMAHMWFGDMVTMRWWDDLWLNEAFAEWACHWATVGATPFTDAWSSFLAGWKLGGYSADMAPTTHPIRQPVHDVAAAAATFDQITYPKGASVLKQLVAYVGEDAFVAGLRSYFARHAWGNTVLDDMMGAIEEESGRDLSAWVKGWLDTAGTDRLVLENAAGGGLALRASGPNGGPPRPHRLDIGVYDRTTQETLVRRDLIAVETSGELTPVGAVADPHLLLVNDEDLTFASTRPDPESTATLMASAGLLPSAVSRSVAVTTAWDMLMTADVSTEDFVRCVTGVLVRETTDSVVEPFLRLAVTAAERWAPESIRVALMTTVADACLALADNPTRRAPALRALARTAATPAQRDALRAAVDGEIDLQWRALIRLAELGEFDQPTVDRLVARDPDPESWVRTLAIRAATNDPGAKQEAWERIIDRHEVPMGPPMLEVATAFWRPGQDDILTPYTERYREALPTMHRAGMVAAISVSATMYPWFGVDPTFADEVTRAASAPEVSPLVRRTALELTDLLRRVLTARGGHAVSRS
jgi:aminopeptidase N